jgi:nitrogen-specific signal transduction histidine kinase/ActR/RegA family two-component response regulator
LHDPCIHGFLGNYHDITDRKRAEVEHAQIQSQLNQAQKTESIGRLAGGVAHDFNNMLQVILGLSDMALRTPDLAPELHRDLSEIRKAARRSVDLTRQFLSFARKQMVSPEVLDLNDTVSGMLTMLQRLIGENVELAWDPSAEDMTVLMDPSQIDQLLTNLCVNARDAIKGVGQLTVVTGTLSADAAYCSQHTDAVPGEYVTLAVSDTGCGIDQDKIKYIFDPFFTTKGIGVGTGLGLSTVYGIVRQNKGFITVQSEPGKGSTFVICLPRHRSEAGRLFPTSGPAKVVLCGHETVLLVEDEPSLLLMGRRMLESLGYQVLMAGQPEEAIAVAGKYAGKIHLLLTDVVMPGMNGLDLVAHLSLCHPGLKYMFMSGYTAEIIAKQGFVEEGIHFIQKPFALQELSKKLRDAFDSQG